VPFTLTLAPSVECQDSRRPASVRARKEEASLLVPDRGRSVGSPRDLV